MLNKSPLGSIPARWPVMRLGDLTTKIGSGATPTGGEKEYLKTRHNFALIRSQSVHDRFFDQSTVSFISDAQAEQLKNAQVKSGDVLLNITGDGSTFARSAIVPDRVLPACVNQHVAIIRANPLLLRPKYLLAFLTHPQAKKYIEAFNAGGSRRAITKGNIESFNIPVPSLREQDEIGDLLCAFDEKNEVNRQMNETLEEMARIVFKDWFIDFGPTRAKMAGTKPYLAPEIWNLFPDSLDDEGKPQGWQLSHIERFVEINPIERLRSGTIAPYLEMAALPTSGPVTDPAVSRIFTSGMRFRNRDTLLARITPCLENGKTAYVQSLADDEVGWGSTEFIVFRARPPVPSAFTYLLARDSTFRAFAIQSMTGTSGRQRASIKAISGYQIIDLPESLWRTLSTILGPLFDRIHKNGEESLTLVATRDLLLPKLISGEISVKEAEKRAA